MTTKKDKTIKALPEYLQPRILSAVAHVHEVAPNIEKAVESINQVRKHLSLQEMTWVVSLLSFEQLLDIVSDSTEFNKYKDTIKKRTIQ